MAETKINIAGIRVPIKKTIKSAEISSDISTLKRRSTGINKDTYQARLGRKLDKVSKKLIDNSIRLTSVPVDMIRVKTERDKRSHDSISRTITANDVISIIFPVIKDIPLRSLDSNGTLSPVPSLYTMNEQTYFEAYCPMYESLDLDDLLIRVVFDEENDRDYVMVLQVKEILGTIGSSSLRYKKYWLTQYDEQLPSQIVDIIKKSTKKRENLNW